MSKWQAEKIYGLFEQNPEYIGRNDMAKATKTSWNFEWKKDASGNYFVCPSDSGGKSSFDSCIDYSMAGVPLGD